MAQLVSVWSNVVRACDQGNDVAPVQQESEQRAVALLSRNTVLEEELDNYKVCGLSAAVRAVVWMVGNGPAVRAEVPQGPSEEVPEGDQQVEKGARQVQEKGLRVGMAQ